MFNKRGVNLLATSASSVYKFLERVHTLGQVAFSGAIRCGGIGTFRVSILAGPLYTPLIAGLLVGLILLTIFFWAANLGRPSSSICMTVSSPSIDTGTSFISIGASSESSSSWSGNVSERPEVLGPGYHTIDWQRDNSCWSELLWVSP